MAIGTVSNARSALQLAGTQLDASAHNTANALTDGFKRVRVDAETAPQGGVRARVSQAEQPGADLVADTIDRISASTLYEANLTVLAVDDELKGALLDTLG
jgi:flagellar hook protein FlgE